MTVWVNIYTHPGAAKPNNEFEGNPHPTKEEADAAAREELSVEPKTRLVRQEQREA